MSQLARGFLSVNQTIYEKIIFVMYYIILPVKIVIYYLFYFLLLIKVVTLNANRPMDLSIENSEVISASLATEYSNKKLNPGSPPPANLRGGIYYVTGFVDGEGCFLINIHTRSDVKLGYNVNLMFKPSRACPVRAWPPQGKLKLHSRDKVLLENIRNYFGQVGNITTRKDGYIEYIVSSKKDLEVIINHFDSYPLITQKWSDFILFKQVFELMQRREHLTIEGLNKILSIKALAGLPREGVAPPGQAVFNNGLSDSLKVAFPGIVPVIRPQVSKPQIQDPH
jgi:hypothetical protein